MMMKKIYFYLFVLLAMTFAVAANAQGIVTGSVTGTVQDPTGASVPNAVITATNAANGVSQTATSNGSGDFSLANMPIGQYKIEIKAMSFNTIEQSNVSVESGKTTGLGIEKLGVGSSVTVEVTAATDLLETVQSQVTTTFDSVQVANLPTGGGFDELALLIPGVVSTHGNNRANTNGAGISSNGQRGRSNNFEVDGQSNNDNSVTGPQIFMSNEEAIQEIQIVTNNFSAQYGRDAGSVVNYITKSGTNSYHGTAIYRYEGAWLSSLTQGQKGPQFGYCTPSQNPLTTGCTAVRKPRFADNQFGGTFGGPILKDRLFGFGSAFFARNFSGSTTSNSGTATGTTGFLPTAAGFSALSAAFPSNPGIQSLIKFGPQAVPLGAFAYILPTNAKTILVSDGVTSVSIPVQQFSRTISSYSTDEEILGRADYQATANDRFFLRYFYQKNPSINAAGTITTGGLVNVNDVTHSVGADWSHTFTPRVVNQLRYSFQQARITFDGGGFASCTVSSLNGCPSSLSLSTSSAYKLGPAGVSTTGVSLTSFGLSTSYPQGRIVKDTQVQDNLNLNFGKHTITIGGSFEYQNSPNVFLPNISGGFTFNGFDGLLTDTATLGLAAGNANIHFTEPDWAAYFQDDWKVSPELTLNLGMRWEYFSQSINLLHDLSLANQTGPSPLWNTSLPQSQTVFPYVPNDYKHFEPRVGFAYNPSAMKSMVLRGGYAINIAPAYYNIFLNSYGSAPVVLSTTVTGCNNTTKQCIPSGGATYTSVHAQDTQYIPTGGTPGAFNQTFVGSNFRQPVTETYSLGIQQQIGHIAVVEARYVGAHTFADFQSINGNPAIGNALKAFPTKFTGVTACADATQPGYNGGNGRVQCINGNVRIRTNTSFEIYNGLQTSINTHNYKGLTANFSYTFSRTIDNASEIFGTNGAGTTVAFSNNPLDPNVGERGVSGQSYPNVTTLGLVYISPFMKTNHHLLGKLLGGYQLNTIYVFNSGQPYTPYQAAAPSGVEANYCDYLFDATFAGPSSCRPILANASAPVGSVGYNAGNGTYTDLATGATVARSSEHWLINNTAEALALGNPYPGVGRNTLRGNSYNNLDASIFKNTNLTERFKLQIGVYLYNSLNRAYYGAPDAAIEDAGATFANFTGNAGSNRNVQVGGKIIF
jgi:hypothetical protein